MVWLCVLFLVAGTRIGEAGNPGPTLNSFDNSDEEWQGSEPDEHYDHDHVPSDDEILPPLVDDGGSDEEFTPPPAADWKLDSQQLETWRDIESALKLKTQWKPKCSDTTSKPRGKPNVTTPSTGLYKDFVASELFKEERPGFVFRSGQLGLGYYKDRRDSNSGGAKSTTIVLEHSLFPRLERNTHVIHVEYNNPSNQGRNAGRYWHDWH
jgi:hypothetical protein